MFGWIITIPEKETIAMCHIWAYPKLNETHDYEVLIHLLYYIMSVFGNALYKNINMNMFELSIATEYSKYNSWGNNPNL